VSALLELGAGFHPELTGRENIYLNGAILGLTRRQIDAAMDDIIDFAGLPDGFIDVPVKVYSSGMYVRLGFSIAVAVDPDILLVDEIVAVGDEEFQRRCFDHLHELRKRGVTIVLVSHAMGLIENLCDEAAWLDHGTLRQVGDARSVVRGYLEEVNEHEAGVAVDAGGAAPETPAGVVRLGTGEVRVTHLEYLDGSGAPASVLVAGEPATFRIHFHAEQPVREPVFGLGFVHESGVTVAGPNSGGDAAIAEVHGTGYVDFHVGSLILLPGVFEVSTAIVHKGHTYDFAERAFDLRVRGSGTEEPGLVRVTGDWTVGGDGIVHDLPPVSDARS
jgi:ABC-2 type transport system ATP-binding protein/lipopolysaccharide transport system ATP-binding protein